MNRILPLLVLACIPRSSAPVESDVAGMAVADERADEGVQSSSLGERQLIVAGAGERLPEGFELPATVLLPEGEPSSAPCVVFIAGSGPTDRDWTSPLVEGQNGSARQLAESLWTQGIGSIRYDKAAIGESTQPIEEVTLDTFRDEAMLAWSFMTEQPVCGRVSFIGNSEGSVHAFRAAEVLQEESRFGGVVSLSGPAKSVLALVKDQLKAQLPEDTDWDAVDAQLDDLEARLRALPEQNGPPKLSLVPSAGGIWMTAVSPLQGELVTDILLLEPVESASAYRGPALVMSADHDIQVPIEEGDALYAALGESEGLRLRVVVDNANHVYKHETRSREETPIEDLAKAYAGAGVPLALSVVADLQSFLEAIADESDRP
jgi:hypothetical protein